MKYAWLVRTAAFGMVWLCAFGCVTKSGRQPTTDTEWVTMADCSLLSNWANDGDSFHAEHEGREYMFRLFYVDTPETSATYPDRVQTQAEYFGTTSDQAIALGKKAKYFTYKQLSRPFTVITSFRDAMGASAMQRFYAFVITESGDDLAMLLVSNGLARVHGAGVPSEMTFPLKGTNGDYKHALYSAQKYARENALGGWQTSGTDQQGRQE